MPNLDGLVQTVTALVGPGKFGGREAPSLGMGRG